MTANLKAAPTPGMVMGCFLNHKGQIEVVARIYRREHDLYLHLHRDSAAPQLQERLQRFIIFDDVQLQDTSDQLATLHLWDEAAGRLIGWDTQGADVQELPLDGAAVLVARVQRSHTTGLDVHYLQAQEAAVLAHWAEDTEQPFSALEAARISAGISDGADRWEGFLPQEVGLEKRTVSYHKGCYVGQEIMARLEARGNTRYGLARLVGEQVAPYTDVQQGDKVVGRTGASSGLQALARLRNDLEASGQDLQVAGMTVSAQPL